MAKTQKDKSIKNWVDFWNSSKGFFDNKPDNEQAEFWNTQWGNTDHGIAKNLKPGRKKKRMNEIFELLEETGFKVKGASILDIGSGPGATSVPFAEAGAKVTALDISSTALEQLKTYADKKGLNINTVTSSWWTADIDKLKLKNKFDLVFVTSTPAVKDSKCLDRMLACSKGYCFYSFFIQNHGFGPMIDEEVISKILKKTGPKNTAKKGSLFINTFMYLYLIGYRPNVKIKQNRRNVSMVWEEAAERSIRSIERFEKCTAAQKRKIREHFKFTAVDGNYKARHSGYSGMMAWKM